MRSSLSPKSIAALIGLLPLASPGAAHGAPGGTMGPTSRASIGISLSIAPRLEVNRGQAVAAAGMSVSADQPFCVVSNPGMGTYSIRAVETSAADGQFPFRVDWTGRNGDAEASRLQLSPGSSATGLQPSPPGGCGTERLIIRPAHAPGTPTASAGREMLLLIAPD